MFSQHPSQHGWKHLGFNMFSSTVEIAISENSLRNTFFPKWKDVFQRDEKHISMAWKIPFWAPSGNFKINFQIFFLAPTSTHPKEKPPPQPPPLGPPAMWPHSGCVKIGSCIPPLVPFLDLCIFALIRKLAGGKPNKGNPPPPLTHPPPKSPPPASTLFPHLPCTSPLVPMMVRWWGMTPMCRFFNFKNRNHVPAGFWKNYFQKMDLPLPWFCSSFWKVKFWKKSNNFLFGKPS